MFTIGEFSKITGLPVKTLRFYHEKGLIVPAAVDPATGYRYYDLRSAETARVIAALRRLEFTLDDIAAILADCTADEDLLAYLTRQREVLAQRVQRYAAALADVDKLIQREQSAQEEQKMAAETLQVEEKDLEPSLVAGVRMKGRYSDCGQGFSQLGKRVGRYIAGKPLCLYYDGEYREEDADFEPCMPIRRHVTAEGVNVRQLPGGHCVSLLHRGPYEELGRSYARVLQYAKQRGYEVTLPTREVYIKGPGMIFRGNPKKYLTEIQLLVESPASSETKVV
ncbi:MAG: MerR family transcriptional regulator [Planctomycetota bacterium]|nr:MAG: MerR family transcriptional regulator [Planctomycetota bacterium]